MANSVHLPQLPFLVLKVGKYPLYKHKSYSYASNEMNLVRVVYLQDHGRYKMSEL